MFGAHSRRIATSCLPSIGAHVTSVTCAAPRGGKRPGLLPTEIPLTLLEADGRAVRSADLDMPGDEVLLALHKKMVLARRFDRQATALTRQVRLGAYRAALGQSQGVACRIPRFRPQDWWVPRSPGYRCTV